MSDPDLREMIAAANRAREQHESAKATAELNNPQYINGTLYVTPKQWKSLHDQWRTTEKAEFGLAPSSAFYHQSSAEMAGIPIVLLEPDVPITRPDGTRLLMSPRMPDPDAVYIVRMRSIFDQIFDGIDWDEFVTVIHDATGHILTMMESAPLRRRALYNAINKPWQRDAWHNLRNAPSRRTIRHLRERWEAEDHVRAIRRVKKSTPMLSEGMNS